MGGEICEEALLLSKAIAPFELGLETEAVLFFSLGWTVMVAPGFVNGVVEKAVGSVKAEIGLEKAPLSRGLVLAAEYSIPVINNVAENKYGLRVWNKASAELFGPVNIAYLIDVPDCIANPVVAIFVLEGVVVGV